MTKNYDKLRCCWCLEERVSTLISSCNKCGDSSYVCHHCLKIGKDVVSNKQLIIKCSICKENKLSNLPNNIQIHPFRTPRFSSVVSVLSPPTISPSNDLENPSERSLSLSRPNVSDYESLKKKIYIVFIWFLIFLVISWMFAPFSYFIVFRMRNSKNYFGKFYITWATGMVLGFPLTILLRHYIRSNCLSNE